MVGIAPAMLAEVHVPRFAPLSSPLRPLVSSFLPTLGVAAGVAVVHSRMLVTMPANVFFVVGVLQAEGGVIQCLHVVFVGGDIIGVPLVFAKQLVVDESHGNRFLEFRGGLLLLPPPHKELLEEEDVHQKPADDGDEDPVFGVPGDSNFFKRPTPLPDCLR